MTFRSLALKNIKENWRSYSAFFLSSLFSVAIFYIYYAFVVHPDVENGTLMAANKVKKGMEYCLYVITIFSVIFIQYSSSSFLKSRKKEFGLFSLFGMTKRQLRKLVFVENMLIGLLSTVTGIAVGILFSKLFLMGLGALLELDGQIRFVIPLKAIIGTVVLFIGIFLVITIYTTMRLRNGQIIELLRAHKQPKGELRFSKFKVLVGTLSIAAGYTLAVMMNTNNFIIVALPILILVILGTFLLYSQLSVVTLQLMKKNKRLFYNRSNMLIISQLGYKIKDNARILFTITILSAVVMTAMGTVYIFQMLGKKESLDGSPYSFTWVEVADKEVPQLDREQLDQLIQKHNLDIKEEVSLTGLQLNQYYFNGDKQQGEENKYSAMIISQSIYNEWSSKKIKSALGEEEAVLMHQYLSPIADQYKDISGKVGQSEVSLAVKNTGMDTIMNVIYAWNSITLIVSDERYKELSESPSVQSVTINGIEFEDRKSTLPLIDELNTVLPMEVTNNMDFMRDKFYFDFIQATSLMIFIGLFICLLFFIAAGSLIYFKLFTERDEDIEMFKGLSRIGITYHEMRKVVVTQIAIIFFLPCIVGIIHALFAMFALDGLLMSSAWGYSFVVFGIYVIMQSIYFLIASRSYLKSIRRGSVTITA